MKKILFVCHGNICRSPMAEFILKNLTNNKYIIESRATSTEELGNDIYPPAKKILDKYNIPYNKHFARQITIEDCKNFDLIICFDEYNINNVKKISNNNEKIIKLLNKDIEDPWYTNNYDKVYHEIYDGCINLINTLKDI